MRKVKTAVLSAALWAPMVFVAVAEARSSWG